MGPLGALLRRHLGRPEHCMEAWDLGRLPGCTAAERQFRDLCQKGLEEAETNFIRHLGAEEEQYLKRPGQPRLYARLLRPRTGGGGRGLWTGRGRPGLALLVHGYQGTGRLMEVYAGYYLARGWEVLLPDNRAHGRSEGDYIGMGILDRDDLLAWLEHFAAQGYVAHCLHGVSMGAAAVMHAAPQLERLPGPSWVVADCGYSSLWEEFAWQLRRQYHLPARPLLHLLNWRARSLVGYDFRQYEARNSVQEASCPLFIIHGREDRFVPYAMAPELYRLSAASHKRFWAVSDTGHALAYLRARTRYEQELDAFFRQEEREYVAGDTVTSQDPA